MKLPTLSSPLKLFEPAPAGPALGMAGASGGHMMFASSGNGGRGGYDDDDLDYEDFADAPPMDDQDPEEEPRRRPRSTRTVRAAGGGETGGQSRVAQHQPEERYWTDYLRIALPVVGILLLLGLLWYWATMLIGDSPEPTDPEDDRVGLVSEGTPTPTDEPAQVGEENGTQGNTIGIGDPASTPEQSSGVTTQPPADPGGSDNVADEPADEETEPEEPADEETGAPFAGGDPVIVTEDGVNVRPDASTAGDPISVVNAGDELTIASGPIEAEGYVWWEVILPDASSSGWIVEDYIAPAE